MMLISLCEHPGKEQRHGVINAGETARRERGCSEVRPCPEEGERSHAAGVLCHYGIQSSLCSLLTAYLCKACDPGTGDLGPHEAVSVAQTAEAPVWSCRSGRAHLGCTTLPESSVASGWRQPCRNSCVPWQDTEPWSRIFSLPPF